MTPAVLDAPARNRGPANGSHRRHAHGGQATLAQLLDGTWRAARAHAEADCPMCKAPMRLANATARCESCGTTLS